MCMHSAFTSCDFTGYAAGSGAYKSPSPLSVSTSAAAAFISSSERAGFSPSSAAFKYAAVFSSHSCRLALPVSYMSVSYTHLTLPTNSRV